jgi:tetratricopeptide (TPR) repeat protein
MRTLAECTSIQAAATHLLETEPWDFAAVYSDAIDHFCHGFMKYHPPKQPHVNEADFHLYQHVVSMGYVYHDMMLGRLIELAGDDATVILMSDHGFHPDHLRPKVMPIEPAGPATEHRDFGIFIASGPGIRSGEQVRGANLLDVTPTILTAYDLPVGEDMDGKVLTDIFEDAPEVQTIPSWEDVPGASGQHSPDFELSAAESKEALEQLVALGYIEPPDDDSDKAVAQCQRELDYNLARSYMDAGLHGEAIPLLASLYKRYPLEFRFGIQLANCLQATQNIYDLGRLVDDLNARWRTTREEARNRLRGMAAVIKARRAQWDEFNRLDEERKDDPNRPPKLARRGPNGKPMLFTEGEQHILRRLRGISRGNPQTLDYLAASVAMARNEYEKALEIMQTSELTKQESPTFQTQVGHVYMQLRRVDEAEQAFRKALELDEYYPNAILGLCRVCLARGKGQEALEHGERAIGLKSHFAPAHYYLGLAREEVSDVDGAIASYEQALAQNPNFVEAHLCLSRLYEKSRNDLDRAAEHRRAADELEKDARTAFEFRDPIELPTISPEELREQLPELPREDPMTSETFLRCLAHPPDRQEREKREAAEQVVTVVSGLPRSGTSMMMQMLAATGIEPFSDGKRSADENNPKGYYEAELVKQISHKNTWVPDCAGHVVKIVAQLIPYLPQQLKYRVIFMDRPIEEVLNSQQKMLDRLGESGGNIEPERLGETFRKQVEFAFGLMNAHGVPVLKVPYGDAIADPADVAARVAEFLGGDLDVDAMAAAVDPKLYRERKAAETPQSR